MFPLPSDGHALIRRAEADEAEVLADLWLRSRRTAAPAIPPAVHSDDEVRGWLRDTVLPNDEVWVIGPAGQPEAMMVLSEDWIEQLYVAPHHQRQGHGSRLVRFAQNRRDSLRLYTFEANHAARAFYEKHGFTAAGPASTDNEERAPALLYRWSVS